MNTIQASWDRFGGAVVPTMKFAEARERNARRCFYAGAWAVLCIQSRLSHMSEAAFTEAMNTIEQECRTHIARVQAGEE